MRRSSSCSTSVGLGIVFSCKPVAAFRGSASETFFGARGSSWEPFRRRAASSSSPSSPPIQRTGSSARAAASRPRAPRAPPPSAARTGRWCQGPRRRSRLPRSTASSSETAWRTPPGCSASESWGVAFFAREAWGPRCRDAASRSQGVEVVVVLYSVPARPPPEPTSVEFSPPSSCVAEAAWSPIIPRSSAVGPSISTMLPTGARACGPAA
mmetsp:Transcript_22065/g.68851  ORF Transcript_22065/g.68851 Transcript_22065/m.68851 type:complete len:211 (-) Transcript_22065:688-1320(-)